MEGAALRGRLRFAVPSGVSALDLSGVWALDRSCVEAALRGRLWGAVPSGVWALDLSGVWALDRSCVEAALRGRLWGAVPSGVWAWPSAKVPAILRPCPRRLDCIASRATFGSITSDRLGVALVLRSEPGLDLTESDESGGRQGWRARKQLRLPNYDYSQRGAYFVTLCAQDRLCFFGEVLEGRMQLSPPGAMVSEVWRELSTTFRGVIVDAFVVMPNHLHGVLMLEPAEQPRDGASRRLSLAGIIQRFKTFTMTKYIEGIRTADWRPFPGRLWQRNYFEHIIRDDEGLNRVRQYIERNPLEWDIDPENPSRSHSRS